MNYWLAAQWPPRDDEKVHRMPTGIWVQDNNLAALDGMNIGDLVFFYESKTGPTRDETDASGTSKKVRSQVGREGVIALARVTAKPFQPPTAKPEEYTDRSKKWWRYCAPAEILNDQGFISRVELNLLLGYKPANRLRGFGDKHSGVKRLEKSVYDKILAKFK